MVLMSILLFGGGPEIEFIHSFLVFTTNLHTDNVAVGILTDGIKVWNWELF